MNTYTVYFRSDSEFADLDIDATTPQQALAFARKVYAEEPHSLFFDHYGESIVNEIAVADDGEEVAVWQDDELRLRLAAQDLLDAVEFCAMTLYDLEASERKGYIGEAIRLARAALAKAKGGAA
jgi:hypothetical protein